MSKLFVSSAKIAKSNGFVGQEKKKKPNNNQVNKMPLFFSSKKWTLFIADPKLKNDKFAVLKSGFQTILYMVKLIYSQL